MIKPFGRITTLIISLLLLSACGGTTDSVITDSGAAGSQKISLNIKSISGLPLDKDVSLVFDGVDLLNAQDIAVVTQDLAVGTSNIELHTSSLIDAKDLKVLVKANGYVDTGVTIQLNKGQEDYSSNIYLIPEESGKVKDGIYTQIDKNLTDIGTDGKVTKEINLVLQESLTTPKIDVTIPVGTTLTGDDGLPVVPTSSIIVRFDPTQTNVLDAYPGGLNVLADISGNMEQVDFKSAAFASIMLKDDAGKKVKNFDKDITIAMQFKEGMTNGDGVIVKLEDTVPVWSYNEDKGTWVYEKDGIVKDLNTSDGLFDVVYQTNHLTYFNLDWKGDSCDSRINLNDPNGDFQNNLMKVVLKMKDYNTEKSFIYQGDGFIDLLRIPDSRDWTLEFYDPFTDVKIDEYSSKLSLCTEKTINAGALAVGQLPVTKTEARVSLECPSGAAVPQVAGILDPATGKRIYPVDVFVMDNNHFLLEYGLAINEPFDFRTYADGVLNIYDLPRNYYDQILNVNIIPAGEHSDLINLALGNTTGPFPIKIGRDKTINDIKLTLPDDYCSAGGYVESKVEATISCPAGNIPNTQSQSLPFIGSVLATNTTDSTSTVFASMESGSVLIDLLKNTDYELTLSHADSTIAANITNNDVTLITAGDNKTIDLLLTDAYCNGSVETPTTTYIVDGMTFTETPFINTTGSIDLNDYFSPPKSTQLRYLEFSKSAFQDPTAPEMQSPQVNDVTINGNQAIHIEDDLDKTEYTTQADRIIVTEYEKDGNDIFIKGRESYVGRLYNPGNTFYKVNITGSNTYQDATVNITSDTDIDQQCVIEEKLSSFTERGYSYSGDIVKVKCTISGTYTVTDNLTSESTNHLINDSFLTYFQKGIGIIVELENNCIPDGSPFPNNTAGCTVNDYTHKFYIEAFPAL